MPRNGELIFAVAIVNAPTARLRLFAPLRRRFAYWRPGHRSTLYWDCLTAGLPAFGKLKSIVTTVPSGVAWTALNALAYRIVANVKGADISS
jgi:hypothetical protein